MNAAICYLTQNTDVRRVYLKTSLYFLFKHFNAEYKYPVIIFHEGDYDSDAQTDVIQSIRSDFRDLVRFQALHPDDFKLPSHIDKEKLDRILSIKPTPVPYWRNENIGWCAIGGYLNLWIMWKDMIMSCGWMTTLL